MSERRYAVLTPKEEVKAVSMAAAGKSQKDIARTLSIAKQSVATFLKQHGLGKRRTWIPTGKIHSMKGSGKMLQLRATITFQNKETGEVKGSVQCYSNTHTKFNRAEMEKECVEHGQKQCSGDIFYEESNEVWEPIYIYKEYKIVWEGKDNDK